MKTNTSVTSGKWQVTRTGSRAAYPVTCHASHVTLRAFTLVEILVVVALLSFIVVALMTVFSSTQTAFQASITQADVLEGGRSAMGMIKSDLEAMTPSFGVSNDAVNFSTAVLVTGTNIPLVQSLTGSGYLRTNVLEEIFILTRQNTTWTGVGYVVDSFSTNYFNPLYRFSASMSVMGGNPLMLFTNFLANSPAYTRYQVSPGNTNMSHLMDGVVDLRVRAYDPGGLWMTNLYNYYGTNSILVTTNSFLVTTNRNVVFLLEPPDPNAGSGFGEFGFIMYSNTLPASVEVNLGVLEDRAIQRAETWPNNTLAQSNYLAGRAGQVHVFRQRVWIRNVDPSAYQ